MGMLLSRKRNKANVTTSAALEGVAEAVKEAEVVEPVVETKRRGGKPKKN